MGRSPSSASGFQSSRQQPPTRGGAARGAGWRRRCVSSAAPCARRSTDWPAASPGRHAASQRLPGRGAAAPTKRVKTTTDSNAALRRWLKQGLQTAFGINSRYADDAIRKANEIIASQRKLIPMEIAETEAKRERTERKRKASQRKVERLRRAGREAEAAAIEQAMRGQQLRLAKLAVYRRHQAEGTIPAVVFGGRRLCRSAGPEHARLWAEWHAARYGPLYSRGDASKGGHPNLRIMLGQHGDFVLSAAISHLSEKTDHSVYVRQGKRQECDTTSEAPRVADGCRRAHVGFIPAAAEPVGGKGQGVVGIDLNPHGVSVANLGRDGNPEAWPAGLAERLGDEAEASLHKYVSEAQVGAAPGRVWLHAPEMWQADADRRAYLVGVVAKLVVDAALAVAEPLAREDLGFAKEHDTNRAFNRYSTNFSYSALAEAVDRRARRLGVPITRVDTHRRRAAGGLRRTSAGRCMRRRRCALDGRRWGIGGGCRGDCGGAWRRCGRPWRPRRSI